MPEIKFLIRVIQQMAELGRDWEAFDFLVVCSEKIRYFSPGVNTWNDLRRWVFCWLI